MTAGTFRWLLKRYRPSIIYILAGGLLLPVVLRLVLDAFDLTESVSGTFGNIADLGLFMAVFPQLFRWVLAGFAGSLTLGYLGPQLLRGGTRASLTVASWGIVALLAAGFTVVTLLNMLLEGRADTAFFYSWHELLNLLLYGLLGLTITNIFVRWNWLWGVAAIAVAVGILALHEAVFGGGLLIPVILIPLLAYLSVAVLRRAVPPVAGA